MNTVQFIMKLLTNTSAVPPPTPPINVQEVARPAYIGPTERDMERLMPPTSSPAPMRTSQRLLRLLMEDRNKTIFAGRGSSAPRDAQDQFNASIEEGKGVSSVNARRQTMEIDLTSDDSDEEPLHLPQKRHLSRGQTESPASKRQRTPSVIGGKNIQKEEKPEHRNDVQTTMSNNEQPSADQLSVDTAPVSNSADKGDVAALGAAEDVGSGHSDTAAGGEDAADPQSIHEWGVGTWRPPTPIALPPALYQAFPFPFPDFDNTSEGEMAFWVLLHGSRPGVYHGYTEMTRCNPGMYPDHCALTAGEANAIFTKGVMAGLMVQDTFQ